MHKVINLVPAKRNIWAYSIGRLDDSEFEIHWNILFNQIKGKEERFQEIRPMVENIAVSVNIDVGKFVPGIEISAEVVQVLADFKFRLDYDVML